LKNEPKRVYENKEATVKHSFPLDVYWRLVTAFILRLVSV